MTQLPELPPALAPLMPHIETNEQRLLTLAALLAPWLRAGMGGSTAHVHTDPCVDETLMPVDLPRTLLQPDHARLLREWCELASASQRCVPHHLLPEVLDRLSDERDPVLADALRSVLGARGAWLAAQRPDVWSVAVPDTSTPPDSLWQAGLRTERGALLQRLRNRDPDQARALVASTLDVDAPDDVAQHIAQLAVGLSMRDHDFLESCLDARHKPVRAASATLLARLPDSARSHRMRDALGRRLSIRTAPSGLLRTLRTTIEIDLPEKLPADESKSLTRDGVEIAKKRGRLGPQAHLLAQLVAGTPLDWYGQQANVDPAQIVAVAAKSEWADALIAGWIEACLAQNNAPWSRVLLPMLQTAAPTVNELLDVRAPARLLQLHPPAEREDFLRDLISTKVDAMHQADVLFLLAGADHPWSEAFSAFVLNNARRSYFKQTPWQLRRMLPHFAPSLHPNCVQTVRDGWPNDTDGWLPADGEAVDALAAALELRCSYLKELRP